MSLHLLEPPRFDLDNCVGRSVSDTIKSHFVEPHYNWSKVSQETFDTWYKCFAQRWNWDIGINETVREAFRLKAQKRLVNTVSDWKRKWETDGDDAKPSSMSTFCWNGLKAYWLDPHVQTTAAKCSAVRNRELTEMHGLFDIVAEAVPQVATAIRARQQRARGVFETGGTSGTGPSDQQTQGQSSAPVVQTGNDGPAATDSQDGEPPRDVDLNLDDYEITL
ncbi:uncharacterized protein LOC112086477 [Eutrema salsugineum]|uniref:uncharacterized protein LOC112086477 n=1 Tax=Eutrema salsugineum TaxID=72664 RepID=UPI000CED0B15|nr:uncharacterized protein LOC112086477 [Eutrema salsugineum]